MSANTYDLTVAAIPKSSSEKILIRTGSFSGKQRIDVRIFFLDDTADEWRPTRKGVSFPVERLGQVIEALRNIPALEQSQEGTKEPA